MLFSKTYARTIVFLILILTLSLITLDSSFATQLQTNTSTVDSSTMGFVLTPAIIRLITQDGSGTVANGGLAVHNYFPINSPGSFTSDPFGCVFTSADFGSGAGGCPNIEGNGPGPVTAPLATGNDFTGVLKSSVSMNFNSSISSGGSINTTGTLDFSICANCNNDPTLGVATLTQVMSQDMNFGNEIGTSTFFLDNRHPDGSAITFNTCADFQYTGCTKVDPNTGGPTLKMDIPWSLDINQNILESPAGNFHTASEGTFTYEVQSNDNTIHEAFVFDAPECAGLGIGVGGSCWPIFGTFSLPGFDMTGQGMGNGTNNFPSPL